MLSSSLLLPSSDDQEEMANKVLIACLSVLLWVIEENETPGETALGLEVGSCLQLLLTRLSSRPKMGSLYCFCFCFWMLQ